MKKSDVVGIDPGVSNGGIATLNGESLHAVKLVGDESIVFLIQKLQGKVVFIEKVNLFLGDLRGLNSPNPKLAGIARGKIMRMQKLFGHYNQMRGMFLAFGIPFVEVHPRSWQSYFNLKGGEGKKERFKKFAQHLFPNDKITLWNCDAACLLAYGIKNLNDSRLNIIAPGKPDILQQIKDSKELPF